ncbi:MAG: hypothetical protein GSR86_00065 [Desulfurococcales archaeon]|nr:hypothetical protein [Desulfurococcales archaeon]
MSGAASARLHPVTMLILLAYTPLALHAGMTLHTLALGALLTLLTGYRLRLLLVYTWIGAPVAVIGWAAAGPSSGVDAAVRLVSLASVYASSVMLVDRRGVSYMLYRIHAPPHTWFLIQYVFRMVEYLGYTVSEARAALRGRGLGGGFRTLLLLPVPLVVHAFNLSTLLAEALAAKAPRRGRTWTRRPRTSTLDYLVALYLIASIAAWYY